MTLSVEKDKPFLYIFSMGRLLNCVEGFIWGLSSNKIIVSQPSKCLKFMTFREGCFVIRN